MKVEPGQGIEERLVLESSKMSAAIVSGVAAVESAELSSGSRVGLESTWYRTMIAECWLGCWIKISWLVELLTESTIRVCASGENPATVRDTGGASTWCAGLFHTNQDRRSRNQK